MKSFYKKVRLFLLSLAPVTVLIFSTPTAKGQTCTYTSVQDGYWTDPATWSVTGGCTEDFPSATNHNVVINHSVTLDYDFNANSSNLTIGSLTISSSGHYSDADAITNIFYRIFNINGAISVSGSAYLENSELNHNFVGNLVVNSSGTFQIDNGIANPTTFSGSITNNGTFEQISSGPINFAGTGTSTITANQDITFNGLIIVNSGKTLNLAGSANINFDNASTVAFQIHNSASSSNTTVNNNCTGVVTIKGGIYADRRGSGTKSFVNNNTLVYEGADSLLRPTSGSPVQGTRTLTNGSGSIIKFARSGNQTINKRTYANLELSGSGNKSIGNSLTVSNNLDIRNSAVLVTPSANTTINVSGKMRFFNTSSMTVPASNTLTVNVSDSLAYLSSSNTTFANGSTSTFTVGHFAQTGGTINLASSNSGSTTINVSGNFAQTGGTITETATLPTTASKFVFNGTSAQQITQSGGATFVKGAVSNTNYPRFVFNNSNGFTIDTDVEVPAITLTEGRVTTGSNVFNVYESDASAVSGGDNDSHIDGKMGRRVATTSTVNLEFPVGKSGECRPVGLEITQAASTPTYYVAEQIENSARNPSHTLPSGILWVSDIRYFRVEKSTGVGVSAKIKLRYGIDDVVAEKEGLTICKKPTSGSVWEQIRPLTTSGDGCVPTGLGEWDCEITSSTFTTFSEFSLGSSNSNNLLPVRLMSFTGRISHKDVVLDWKTASESNSSHFVVERSTNGKDFKEIGRVSAAGNSNSPKSYQLVDAGAATKKTSRLYYRLRQVDLDGTQEFSHVVVVILTPSEKLTAEVYPNPFDDQVSINISAQGAEKAQIEITDLTGKIITQQIIGLSNGSYNGLLNTPVQLPSGVYLMRVSVDSQVKTVKMIKK